MESWPSGWRYQVRPNGEIIREASGGITTKEAEELIAAKAAVLAPAPSGDKTGVADSANLQAAQPAKGSLIFQSGAPYYIKGGVLKFGPEQGFLCLGMPELIHIGAETLIRINNPAMSVEGGEAEFTKNMPGRFDPITLNGLESEAGAVGVQIGDINDITWHGAVIRGYNKAGSIGFLGKSEVAWCERCNIVMICSGNTTNVEFTNGGTATGAFDYSHFDFSIQAKINQHGVVMNSAVGFWGSHFRLSGNCFTGVGNAGVAWKLGADNTSVQLLGCHIEIQLETDGNAGVGHKTIERGTKAEVSAEGVLSFKKGGTVAWTSGNIIPPDSRFSFDGIINVDENMGTNVQGEGLNVLGGSTWSRGFTTVKEGNLELGVNSGDYFIATLAAGVNTLKLNNSSQRRARRLLLVVTQAEAGAGTLLLTNPGNNLQGNVQTISGPTLNLQTAPNAINVLELTTPDGQNWYISMLGPRASTDAYLGILRPAYAPGIIPTGESVIGVAFRAVLARSVIPVTGILRDITVFNGALVAGNHNVAIYDTGQAEKEVYTPLWESGVVAAAGENKPQVIGSPVLSVVAGQQIMMAVMNDSITHKFGQVQTAGKSGWFQLPGNFIPTGGGTSPKLAGEHTFAELKYLKLKEAELELVASPPLAMVGRIT